MVDSVVYLRFRARPASTKASKHLAATQERIRASLSHLRKSEEDLEQQLTDLRRYRLEARFDTVAR